MKILILSVILLFVTSVGLYYAKILKRIFRNKKLGYWVIGIYFFAFFLSFNTINVFSSIGIFLIHFLVFSLVSDILNLILKKTSFQKIWNKLYQFSVIPLLITSIFFIFGYFNIRNIVETNYTIKTVKNIEPLRILFLSDSHYGTVLKKTSLELLKKEIEQKDIDLILLGGDIVDENTSKEEMEEILKIIGSFKNKLGVYFIYGNHDRQKYSTKKHYNESELNQVLENVGIKTLEDEVLEIGDILLVGREDLSASRISSKELLKNQNTEKYIIMVDHQPVEYENNAQSGVDLMLSGHTHAGQIFPAGYLIKWFHMSDLWYGHTKIGNMDAIVSSGLAGWGYPIRTQKNSEYVIIDIQREV